ncbi:VWA domain-containing protein [Shimia sp. R9_2]|uniref:vWA domain-containing protein n=1 Tax=Shimia sp. R9_2 TaxID=2821112 RepID=UPI001FFDFEEC|nr:VWA domain-containing protein [Shimia sp. R9_2]
MLRFALSFCLITSAAAAQNHCPEDAMIVFDGSGSMAEMGFNNISEPRIFEARRAIKRAVPDIARTRRLGLIVYGPGGENTCSGLDLRFPPTRNAAGPIITAIERLQPAGETAIADAVSLAAKTLNGKGTIVLVTDGKETCGGAPCQVAAELAATTDLTVHVIGFKVRGDRFSWAEDSDYDQKISVAQCLSERTGGYYVGTETVDELVSALQRTLGCPLLF